MRFDWDDRKAATNLRKHGVAFEDAIEVFLDPHSVQIFDDVVDWEERWRTIGLVKGISILLVAHTLTDDRGDDVVRIISARKATPHEQRIYEAERSPLRPL